MMTFVSISASEAPDEAVSEAYEAALNQHPGWIPLKGTADALDNEKLREIAQKVLGQ